MKSTAMLAKPIASEAADELSLRPLCDRDLPTVAAWLSRPHVAKWFTHPDAWMEEMKKRETEYSFIRHFILTYRRRDVGFCQYYEYDKGGESWHGTFSTEHAYSLDYLIGEEDRLGIGLGKRAVRLLTESVFRATDASTVLVQPEKENARSRATLLAAGFRYDAANDIFFAERKNL